MKKNLLLLFFMLVSVSFAFADTYKHEFASGQLSINGGTATLSDYVWTYPASSYIGWDNNKGIQIGKKAEVTPSFSLTSSAFSEYTIKSITVNSMIASSGDAKLTIAVGDKKSEAFTLTGKSTDYTFETDAKGDITISWTATQRAYYVKSITIEYSLPASMITVPTPVFTTPEGVYVDKVKVEKREGIIAEVPEDSGAVLYYTIDGSDPNPDDESGITKCSKGWQLWITNVTESTTVRAMAVITTDEGVNLCGDIVEANYIVSPKTSYVLSEEIVSGKKYAFSAADSIANPFIGKQVSGYLNSAIPTDKYSYIIESAVYNAFTFTATNGGYTIQDPEGRYLYLTGSDNTFNVSEEKPSNGAIWSVAFNGNGKATVKNTMNNKAIYYSALNDNFGCYDANEVTADMELIELYLQAEFSYTVTPELKSTHDTFQTITITSESGIKAGEDFKATTILDDETVVLTCTQIDANTIALSFAEPLVRDHNTDLRITLSGTLIFDPTGLAVSKNMNGTTLNYILNGHVETTITKVTPEDKSTVVKLYYFLFEFSYYASATEDTSITPRLYKEGNSDRLFKVEYTRENQDADGYVDMMEGAIRLLEPVTESGTYILEIPDGYFEADGKPIKGITIKYYLEYDPTGIENIIAEEENGWVVYNMNGIKVMETKDTQILNTLPKGLYIINGVKTLVK